MLLSIFICALCDFIFIYVSFFYLRSCMFPSLCILPCILVVSVVHPLYVFVFQSVSIVVSKFGLVRYRDMGRVITMPLGL